MINYIKLLRIKHWIKNFLIFVPLFFSLNGKSNDYLTLIIGFISFSLLASSIYIINDIFDKENDKNHPEKKNRPIASDEISLNRAVLISIILFLLSIILNNIVSKTFFCDCLYLLLLYFILNIFYSKCLKDIPIIDIFVLAGCFIIRLFYGARLVDINISEWLLLTTLNAALFLGIGKRKGELNYKTSRKVLNNYTKEYLDKFSIICISLTIMFYSLWVMSQNNTLLYFSIPIVLFIIMQYTLSTEKTNSGDPVSIFLNNKSILISTIFYIVYMYIALY